MRVILSVTLVSCLATQRRKRVEKMESPGDCSNCDKEIGGAQRLDSIRTCAWHGHGHPSNHPQHPLHPHLR